MLGAQASKIVQARRPTVGEVDPAVVDLESVPFPASLDGTGAVPHHQCGGHPLGQRPRGAGHRADVDTVTDQELQPSLAE